MFNLKLAKPLVVPDLTRIVLRNPQGSPQTGYTLDVGWFCTVPTSKLPTMYGFSRQVCLSRTEMVQLMALVGTNVIWHIGDNPIKNVWKAGTPTRVLRLFMADPKNIWVMSKAVLDKKRAYPRSYQLTVTRTAGDGYDRKVVHTQILEPKLVRMRANLNVVSEEGQYVVIPDTVDPKQFIHQLSNPIYR